MDSPGDRLARCTSALSPYFPLAVSMAAREPTPIKYEYDRVSWKSRAPFCLVGPASQPGGHVARGRPTAEDSLQRRRRFPPHALCDYDLARTIIPGMRARLLTAAAAALLALSTSAAAEDYPARPVRIFIPLAAGGGGDVFTRAL